MQYGFSAWSDSGSASHTVTAPSTPYTWTATFVTQYYLTTSATAGGNVSPLSGWYNPGAVVTLTANAGAGYTFAGFSGNVSGNTGISITMSAPEVPSALDRGVVDGIFTAGVGAVLWKDLLKFGYALIVNVNNSYFIANTDAYRKLSPELRDQVLKAAEDAARWDQDTMKTEEAESVQLLRSAGYTFTQARPDEITRAVDAMRPYWDEWAKTRGPQIVEALGKVRAALGR